MATHLRQPAAGALAMAFVLAVTAVAVAAPQSPAPRPESRATNAAPEHADGVGGLSLSRIRRELRETPPTPDPARSSLLKLEYYVEVIGTPPPIEFFKDFNIGPASSVQYGGMTHSEFLRITAPFWRKW